MLVDGAPVTGPTRKVGYMLQQDYLFEWRTILENAVLGAEIQGADMRRARERAAQLLTRYGLGQFLHHLPRQLSGGMRQRVALARTLCTEPDVVLLDEPFSALDSQTRIALADEVTEILRREGKTAILVTHDIGEAVSMAERVIVLSRRPGRVKSDHAIRFASADGAPPGAVRGAQRARVQRLLQCPLEGARSPCRRLKRRRLKRRAGRAEPAISRLAAARAAHPPDHPRGAARASWSRSSCCGRSLPRAHLINPLFTSYPSAIWPTFLDMLKATPQQPGILTHTWATVLATVVGFTAAMVLGVAIAAALWWWDGLYKVLDPYLVVANAMPKTAFVPIFYIWLGAALSVYGMSLAISLFITILMIYSGFQGIDPNKIKLAQTFGAIQGADPDQGGAARQRADPDRGAQGQRRAVARRRGGRRIPVRQSRARLSDRLRQPDLQDEHRDDRDHDPGDRVVADVSRDLLARSRRDAAAVARTASYAVLRCATGTSRAAASSVVMTSPKKTRKLFSDAACSSSVSEALPSDSMTTR